MSKDHLEVLTCSTSFPHGIKSLTIDVLTPSRSPSPRVSVRPEYGRTLFTLAVTDGRREGARRDTVRAGTTIGSRPSRRLSVEVEVQTYRGYWTKTF